MRACIIILAAIFGLPVQAEDAAKDSMADIQVGIIFNTSIGINAPLTAVDRAGKAAEEDAYRQSLYQRAVAECDSLTATIAKSCAITAVNVSTQISSNPGQQDFLNATASISMTVDLK